MPRKQGSIGKPVPGQEVKIMSKNGEFINEPGVDGEIVVRYNTPVAFLKYWNNEKETQKKVVNGWLYTGDFALKMMRDTFISKVVRMILSILPVIELVQVKWKIVLCLMLMLKWLRL